MFSLLFLIYLVCETGSHVSKADLKQLYVIEDDPEFPNFQPPPPSSWDYRQVPHTQFLCGAGDQNLGFMNARQALYQQSGSPDPNSFILEHTYLIVH